MVIDPAFVVSRRFPSVNEEEKESSTREVSRGKRYVVRREKGGRRTYGGGKTTHL